MTLTRKDFVGVMKNAVSGLGLAPDAAMVTFPIDMFLPGSDISSLEMRKREFYEQLTGWKSEFDKGAAEAKMLRVEGATYEDALIKANNLLLKNLWGDGLPLWPATRERVDWILRGSALPRSIHSTRSRVAGHTGRPSPQRLVIIRLFALTSASS